ncbi:MAG: hypothetical protein IJE25_03325 [Clostridia bacterium]|nr:hypothetical protein [Clostridia bacterium]
MDDMERYGDYNEVDESPRKSPVLRAIKLIAVVLIFAIIGFLAFRLFTVNYYPKNMKALEYTDALAAHYKEKGGNISVLTQKLKAPYDDEKDGNFFCDHLRVCREAGTLQITLRYNVSLSKEFKQDLGCDVDMENQELFTFRLWRSGDQQYVGTLAYVEWDSFMMYRYVKLVFEDVDFSVLENSAKEDKPNWLMLDIHVDGVQYKDKKTKEWLDKEFKILVYENREEWYHFKEYKLSKSEVPK